MSAPFQLVLAPNPTTLGRELVNASELLARTPLCREILAENMLFSGGIERLYQRLFLWAFHTQGATKHFLALELKIEPLVGNEALDVICYRWTPEIAACIADRQLYQVRAAEWFTHAVGAVEIKDNWNRASIPSDIAKLRRIHDLCMDRGRDRHEYYELLLIQNWTYDETWDLQAGFERELKRTMGVFVDAVPCYEVIGVTEVLKNTRNPSDSLARVVLVAILVRVIFNG